MSSWWSGVQANLERARSDLQENLQHVGKNLQHVGDNLKNVSEGLGLENLAEQLNLGQGGPVLAEEAALASQKAAESVGSVDLLPWDTRDEAKSIVCSVLMEQVLCLSLSKETFTAPDPEQGEAFLASFRVPQHVPCIQRVMDVDTNLRKQHSTLSLKIPEASFWGNYFSRVSALRAAAGVEPLVPVNQPVTVTAAGAAPTVSGEKKMKEESVQPATTVGAEAEVEADGKEEEEEPDLDDLGDLDDIGSIDSNLGSIDDELEAQIAAELED